MRWSSDLQLLFSAGVGSGMWLAIRLKEFEVSVVPAFEMFFFVGCGW